MMRCVELVPRKFASVPICIMSVLLLLVAVSPGFVQAAVGGEEDYYFIGGFVTGMPEPSGEEEESYVVLGIDVDNEYVEIFEDGPFEFIDAYPDGTEYEVYIEESSDNQTCYIVNGESGIISGEDVTDIEVECYSYTVGGIVAGLVASDGDFLELELESDWTYASLEISENGDFVFPANLADGSFYQVSISHQPPNQSCSIVDGTATGSIIGEDVTSVRVVCVSYTVGGTVTGLVPGNTIHLRLEDDPEAYQDYYLDVTSNGSFTFEETFTDGTEYVVYIDGVENEEPFQTPQTCTIANASGIIDGSSVDDIEISCSSGSGAMNTINFFFFMD